MPSGEETRNSLGAITLSNGMLHMETVVKQKLTKDNLQVCTGRMRVTDCPLATARITQLEGTAEGK